MLSRKTTRAYAWKRLITSRNAPDANGTNRLHASPGHSRNSGGNPRLDARSASRTMP